MPRKSRKRSNTGIYHVMVRGNERKAIFNDEEDKAKFIRILSKTKRKTKFDLYSYCLMNNHFHLVVNEKDESISKIMKIINVSYARYFNKKYDRVGHVFQGRYRSEPIEDDNYLLAVVRYVHNNPIKAKFINNLENYKWSSYNEYVDLSYKKPIIDRTLLFEMFSSNNRNALLLFKEFTKEENKDIYLEVKTKGKKKSTKIRGLKAAENYLNKYVEIEKIDLDRLKSRSCRDERNKLIKDLRAKSNLSIRDIARLLKLNRGMVSDGLK